MEAEAARIAAETEDLDSKSAAGKTKMKGEGKALTADEKIKRDGHSIYVGRVDYTTTPEELVVHFESCGTIERVTIVCDKFTGNTLNLQMMLPWTMQSSWMGALSKTDS